MWRIRWNVKRFWVGELDLDRVDLADLTDIRPGTIGEIMNDAHDRGFLQALSWTFDNAIGEALIFIWDLVRKHSYKEDRVPFFTASSERSGKPG